MATCNVQEQKTTAYHMSRRKDYGEIVSIDVNVRLIKEFLQAKMYVEIGMPISTDAEVNDANMKVWSDNVKPFFEHMAEVIDSL